MKDVKMTLKLTRVLLKSVMSDFSLNKKSNKKGFNNLMLVIVAIAFIPMIASFCFLISNLYDTLSAVPGGFEKLILSLIVSGFAVIYFVIGIFYTLGVFYYSNDNERVFALPLKTNQILTARFLTIVIYEYVFLAIMFIPTIVTYGIKAGASPIFYVYMILVGAFICFIPICVCSILLMVLMRFSSIFKNRDKVNIIGSIALIGVILYFNSTLTSSLSSMNGITAANTISTINERFSGILSIVFAGTSFASDALLNYNSLSGLLFLLIFIAFCIGWYLLFLLVGQVLYKKGVLGLNSSSSKKKILNKSEFEKGCRPRNKYISYMLKDFRIIIRTPVFLLNNMSTIILLPVILSITFLVPGLKDDPDITFLMSAFSNNSLSFSSNFANVAMAAFFATGCINSAFSGIASSAISREGSNAYYMKFVPLKFYNQLFAKAGLGCLIGILSSFTLIILIGILFKANPLFVIIGALLSVFPTVIVSLTGIFLDSSFPLLNWDNEQKAVKQNMNVLLNMLIGGVLAAGSVMLAVYYIKNVFAVIASLIVISVLMIGLLIAALTKYSDKLKSKIS